MKTIDFSYYIERYNSDEMSESELVWFKKELEGNERLKREVIIRKRTEEILSNRDIISLRNKLSGIEKARAVNVPARNPKRGFYVTTALVAVIVILTGTLSIFTGGKLSNDKILSRYYKEYQPASGQRSLEIVKDNNFNQAMEYFESSDYRNAALFFNRVVESNPKNMYANLLNGISNYEVSKYNEAKQSLGKVIDNKNNYYVDQAQWYLALCYLKTDDNDKAIALLKVIGKEGGYYAKEAKKILKVKK